jgi:UPF0176 protein
MGTYKIVAFYRFAPMFGIAQLRDQLHDLCTAHGIKGMLLLAEEGLNGTLAGYPDDVDNLMSKIRHLTNLDELNEKISYADKMPFLRTRIRVKAEIVTIGDASVDPLQKVGTYVAPQDWNELINDPDVLLIDTRNGFEHAIGTFAGALNPETETFGDFPVFVKTKLEASRHTKIAMFCTGGIRCEKASSYMLGAGFDEVYHLKGGILAYLEQIRPEESLWSGSCFVFDQRLALGHGLVPEPIRLCINCSAVIDASEIQKSAYEPGVCCSKCAASLTEVQKASSRERQRQIHLARAKGKLHIGPEAYSKKSNV